MPVLKMEYVTVLKNPETHVNIGELPDTEKNENRILSRLCVHADKRVMLMGVLLLFTLLLYVLTHVQSQEQSELIKQQGQKLRHLEILLRNLTKEISVQNLTIKKVEAKKSRQIRTASTVTPHFYLKGWPGVYSNIDASDEHGIFRWTSPPSRSFNRGNDVFHADATSGYLTKVQIVRPGMYFIFAKVTANGRDNYDSDIVPPVGINLMKNDEILDTAWTTQDERGRIYSPLRWNREDENKFPMDTLTIMGLHYLTFNDNIYIQRPTDRPYNEPDRFLTGNQKLEFGAFLVEGCTNC